MTGPRFATIVVLVLAIAACRDDAGPVRDKTYYLAHREELEAELRTCRNRGFSATDVGCQQAAAIRTEILKDDVRARMDGR